MNWENINAGKVTVITNLVRTSKPSLLIKRRLIRKKPHDASNKILNIAIKLVLNNSKKFKFSTSSFSPTLYNKFQVKYIPA